MVIAKKLRPGRDPIQIPIFRNLCCRNQSDGAEAGKIRTNVSNAPTIAILLYVLRSLYCARTVEGKAALRLSSAAGRRAIDPTTRRIPLNSLCMRKCAAKISKVRTSTSESAKRSLCYVAANSFCISSRVKPLVSGYTNRTTKNCRTIITEKKTNG